MRWTVNLTSAFQAIFDFIRGIIAKFFDIGITFGQYTVPLFYFIFGGILISAVIAFITKAVAKG